MLLFCLFTLSFTSNVTAQGVAAGTDISNTVIVNYSVDGTIQEPSKALLQVITFLVLVTGRQLFLK